MLCRLFIIRYTCRPVIGKLVLRDFLGTKEARGAAIGFLPFTGRVILKGENCNQKRPGCPASSCYGAYTWIISLLFVRHNVETEMKIRILSSAT